MSHVLPRIAAAFVIAAALSPATHAGATTPAEGRAAVAEAPTVCVASVSDQARRTRKAPVVALKRSAPPVTHVRRAVRLSYIHGVAY